MRKWPQWVKCPFAWLSVKSFKLTSLNYRKGKPGSFSKGRPGPPEPKKTLLGRRVDQSQER